MFLMPKARGAEEKKSEVGTMVPFLRFFKIFRSDFRKYFNGVFEFLMQRNGQKRDKKTKRKTTGNKFFSSTFGKKLLTRTSPKKLFMVFLNFELPVLRNAQKRHKKGLMKKKVLWHLAFIGYLQGGLGTCRAHTHIYFGAHPAPPGRPPVQLPCGTLEPARKRGRTAELGGRGPPGEGVEFYSTKDAGAQFLNGGYRHTSAAMRYQHMYQEGQASESDEQKTPEIATKTSSGGRVGCIYQH
jgi:hypothetical protein